MKTVRIYKRQSCLSGCHSSQSARGLSTPT